MVEKTEWGEVDWQGENDVHLSERGMHVGIVTVKAGMHQPEHTHYDEQVFYALSGEAIMYVDGVRTDVKPGELCHWKPGIIHEVFCKEKESFRHLVISNPSDMDIESFLKPPNEDMGREKYGEQELSRWLYSAVEAIRTQFLETLQFAYSIFDLKGNVVIESDFRSDFCMTCCYPMGVETWAPCMETLTREEMGQENTITCPYGMTVFRVPLNFNCQNMGYIQGGYIRRPGIKFELMDVYEITESTEVGVCNLLRKIAKAIRNYCEFEQFHEELASKENQIADKERKQRMLMKNLKDAQYAMTDLRINNHFLFNTLNSMASMALDGKRGQIYQSIVDLSRLFRYNLLYTSNIVPLSKEFEYLKAYLELQKLRYKSDLVLEYDVDHSLDNCQVPYNFLQPIAENAFKHGFSDMVHKRITVHLSEQEGRLDVHICNSGRVIDQAEVFTINERMRSNSSHGLSLVYYKLSSMYGEDFLFEIMSDAQRGTRFHLQLPIQRMEDTSSYDKSSDM